MSSSQLVNRPAQRGGDMARVKTDLDSMLGEIARTAPKHIDASQLTRIVMTEVQKNRNLLRCTPASFLGAVMNAATLGLQPGVGGECYLVPYGQDCQLIVGYQGLVKLFYQHPDALNVMAEAVYADDEFSYELGTHPDLTHVPRPHADGDQPVYYYAVAQLRGGGHLFKVLTAGEVAALRGGRKGPMGDIQDPQHWMEKKTVLKQLLKMLPKSTRLQAALAADETTTTPKTALTMMQQVQPVEVEPAGEAEK